METVATCQQCGYQRWLIFRDRITCCECGWNYFFTTGDEEPFAGPQLARELLRAVNQQSE